LLHCGVLSYVLLFDHTYLRASVDGLNHTVKIETRFDPGTIHYGLDASLHLLSHTS